MVEGLNSTMDFCQELWLHMGITPSSLLRDEFKNELRDFGGAISIGLYCGIRKLVQFLSTRPESIAPL